MIEGGVKLLIVDEKTAISKDGLLTREFTIFAVLATHEGLNLYIETSMRAEEESEEELKKKFLDGGIKVEKIIFPRSP